MPFVPTITKSVKQGVHATKRASLLRAKRELENDSLMTVTGANSRTAGAGSKMQSYGDAAKGLNCTRKKRKTKRSRQVSLLDEQGKYDLLKRCEAFLAQERE